jgi:hypothetical protein
MDKETKQILSPTERIGRYREIELLQLKRILASTPAQRLTWLEEALQFAYFAWAIPSTINSHHQGNMDLPGFQQLDE